MDSECAAKGVLTRLEAENSERLSQFGRRAGL
jgi:hypothetical protein